MVLDRADNVINVCELKYAAGSFVIDKAYANALDRKVTTFAGVTKTRKAVHLTMITSNGLLKNAYSGRVQTELTLADLFVR